MKSTPKHSSRLQADDWTILVALIFTIGACISGIWAACAHLLGVPAPMMPYGTWVKFRKILLTDIIICHFVYGLIKISVVLFYKRIFTTRRFKTVVNVVIGLVAGFMIASFFAVLFCARGVSSFWTTPAMLDGTQLTINLSTVITAFAAIDIGLDVIILSLPLPMIKSMQMSTRKKFFVAGIFLLGAFCLVSTAVRLYYAHYLLTYRGFNVGLTMELTEKNDMWAHIEACASVLTACLPTLGPLVRSLRIPESAFGSFRTLFSLSSGTRSKRSLDEVKLYSKQDVSMTSTTTEYAGDREFEMQNHDPNTIKVERSFRTEVQP
ncbi:hypothetical protein K469DRAFT_678100 [Zopfia rhizophila CBS 207.26]|uniref:Rhodopsin domain-containing protein n=1 Tax=Zopfia rhizophila CBS 207.26 TaxID=1314779 RepID=A0A6A6DFR0_9PEZI|nr:hypothetical protein K469DRAFT_678100 [Zopfia rhizophila CBS 207.26]